MKKLGFALPFLFICVVWASGGHEEASGEHVQHIPLTEIGWQAANLGLLLIGLFFAVKKSVVAVFEKRQKDFVDQSEKTKSALKGAEAALAGVKTKLQELESGEKKSIENATHEAALLKASLIKESESQAEKLKSEAQVLIRAELEKAKAEISTLILGGALGASAQKISSKAAQITKDSEVEFLKQIGQVKA